MKIAIDYSQHPAFRASLRSSAPCPLIRQYFADLDNLWGRLVGNEVTESKIAGVFHEERQRLMARIGPELIEHTDPVYRPYVIQAFDRSADAILKEVSCVVMAKITRPRRGRDAEAIAEKLRDVSIVGFPMDATLRESIARSLDPYMNILREQRRTNGGARCFVAVPSWGKHWQLVKGFLKKNRIEEGISAYAGYPLKLSGYALTYSHPDENWFKKCYADIGLDVSSTVQMHFDEDNTSAKSMLYLNDIESDNGPFSYVPRSAAHMPSRSQLSFFKYLDFAQADFARTQAVDGGTYNRALFTSPLLRRHFARLPSELQGSSCLGDDILDDTPLSRFLLENERQITTAVGDLALFAGGETLHRGGIVQRGERWALQMIYRQPPSYREKVLQQTTAFLIRARNRYRELVS
jgi:hypothetical protein